MRLLCISLLIGVTSCVEAVQSSPEHAESSELAPGRTGSNGPRPTPPSDPGYDEAEMALSASSGERPAPGARSEDDISHERHGYAPLFPHAPADVAHPRPESTCTPSGLCLFRVSPENEGGKRPSPSDRVKVHYSGWTQDGELFDSSIGRGSPATFGVSSVIKGWTEGLQRMRQGETYRVWIPADLAYGETPSHPGAPAGQLTFEIQLLTVVSPPPTPIDVAAPPAGAQCTRSGLCYTTLKSKAHDGTSPQKTDRVTVHYSGWWQDGRLFDSSLPRGRPSTFGVSQVIEGWTEVLQMMKVGQKVRVWIPPDLAYGETESRPGAPYGQLTFEIELLEIE